MSDLWSTSKEFIKGFIAGQIILICFMFFLIKFFLFQNPSKNVSTKRRRKIFEVTKTHSPQNQALNILSKIRYDPNSTGAETCEWLNVLIAQAIAKYRNDSGFLNRIIRVLDEEINGSKKPNFLSPITITEFSLGEDFPMLKSSCIRFVENSINLRAEIRFEFHDQITLGIETQVLVNWPKIMMAALPVALSVTLTKFSGTISIEFINSKDSPASFISISILEEDLNLEFDCKSMLGNRTKVKDLPKLTQLIINRLRKSFFELIVFPNSKKFNVPSFWPDAEENFLELNLEQEDELENLIDENLENKKLL
ncbi:ERMES complex subunit mmm1 [Clydaea vesicula]|uniref:Maintenance of mitochondrial morphology protein 1 n=1 Tax=Clydaea vesicula TaxID=447962 RepID=A0AAD5U1I3_9FUNG|nr:ERMES complex subunit mmm1 [Clydaea vesicula]KAJ3388181.1 ERMES complex subunit mmm1 [Lobulomyces angularis]